MKKIILITILLASVSFAQSKMFDLLTLYSNDDTTTAYTPPDGYEFFITSDGDTLKTSGGEYFLVKTSILYQIKNILDNETIYADNKKAFIRKREVI